MIQFARFAESPFEPLGRHMEKVKECVALVAPMFESLLSENWDELNVRAHKIFKIEHQADIIKNEIREIMPRSFSLPIFRGDLLAYLKLQDDMADTAEDIGVVLTLKNLPLPPQLVDDLRSVDVSDAAIVTWMSEALSQLHRRILLTARPVFLGHGRVRKVKTP